MSEVIFLSQVRLSFPQLVEPRAATEGGVKKYSADFILDQNDPGFQKFMVEYAKLASEKWGNTAQNVMQMIQSDRKLRCYGAGAEKIDKKTFQPYSGYEGKVYISANKDVMPQMIRADGNPIDAGNTMEYQSLARKLYGGCYVNAAIRPWLQDNKHGRGVRCDLIAIQFAKDGEAFGDGVADVSGMFGAVAAAPAPAAPAGMPLPPFMMGVQQ
jgi:hypothetical protein